MHLYKWHLFGRRYGWITKWRLSTNHVFYLKRKPQPQNKIFRVTGGRPKEEWKRELYRWLGKRGQEVGFPGGQKLGEIEKHLQYWMKFYNRKSWLRGRISVKKVTARSKSLYTQEVWSSDYKFRFLPPSPLPPPHPTLNENWRNPRNIHCHQMFKMQDIVESRYHKGRTYNSTWLSWNPGSRCSKGG